MYDPQIARFHTMDPHAESYVNISPFAYVANNPLIYVDPDGRDIRIKRDDEERTVKVEGNFYFSSSQIDPSGDFGSVEALIKALNSWSSDIETAIGEIEGLEGYSVNVSFSMVDVDIGDRTGDDAISHIRSVADADPIGNSFVHDPNRSRAGVANHKHMSANMGLVGSDPVLFAGYRFEGEYCTGNTLKREIGHFFGLRDRTGREGHGSHIPNDLMSYDHPTRGNAVQPFIRVMTFTGLRNPGSISINVNRNLREPL